MNQRRSIHTRSSLCFAIGIVAVSLTCTSACNSNSRAKSLAAATEKGGTTATPSPHSTAASTAPDINLNCVYDRLQNPPESFHYVYKKSDSDGAKVDQEADVTPQAINGFRAQADGSQQPIHAVRSDSNSWQSALAGLTGISGMSGTVATFNHSSAMQRESDGGQLNGYPTIHYSIDTARWDATTRQMLGNFALGPGGFDKGDVWVMADGCPVKLVLDEEMHKKDGTLLETVHYEETMAKN